MKAFCFFVLTLAVGSAFANGKHHDDDGGGQSQGQGQLQAQGQGQQQGQTQGQLQAQGQLQLQLQGQAMDASNNAAQLTYVEGTSIHFEAQKRNPVNTSWAPPLAVSSGTCFGSASGGVQTTGVGLSFGSTTFDEHCDRRADAQALHALGMTGPAVALLCSKPSISEAMAATGYKCPAKQSANKSAAAGAAVTSGTGTTLLSGSGAPVVSAR